MITPDRGYLVFSTDFALSSHAVGFTVPGGLDSTRAIELTSLSYFVPAIAYEPGSDTLFLPAGGTSEPAIHAYRGATAAPLPFGPIPTSGPPSDIVIVPGPVGDEPAAPFGGAGHDKP
jgi:hypothetical protein